MTTLDGILGRAGDPVECREITDDVSMHWYPPDAKPGDPCLCGKLRMKDPD
jgi:hypothetical protein